MTRHEIEKIKKCIVSFEETLKSEECSEEDKDHIENRIDCLKWVLEDVGGVSGEDKL